MLDDKILQKIRERNPHEDEFLQAVEKVVHSVQRVLERHPEYDKLRILERLAEPERMVSFKVSWLDDQENVQINRGYRVQMNSAIGPYKGGLRFHPSVNPSILKFLAFEQIFKNALTSLPLGGGKGGSDFNPKGRSETEIMRFCQAFMLELYRHIGDYMDVPAGDIGVGAREIGYMYGMYKKIRNEFKGVLTGKGSYWGGSEIRPEATGYGLIYFAGYMLENNHDSLEHKTCLISGAGNVAQYAIEKLLDMGAKPISVSDSDGFILDHDGIDREKLEFIKTLKNQRRGRINEYKDKYPQAEYYEVQKDIGHNPLWETKADCAFPCATQNEINEKDAQHLVDNNIKLLAEGANLPCNTKAIDKLQDSQVLYAPSKAANAGGVAVSGLEMTQNRMGSYWNRNEVDKRLNGIMKNIHDACLHSAESYGLGQNYLEGANIFGFLKVAEAMKAQGIV